MCCACDPNERLSVPSIGFVYVFCMSEVFSSFNNLRDGSQVFALRVLSLCVILHTVWLGKSLNSVAMHLDLWYVVLLYHQYDVCKTIMLEVAMVV